MMAVFSNIYIIIPICLNRESIKKGGDQLKTTEYQDNLNPFTAIWTRPRETVRYVIEEKESNFSFLLIVLSGFVGGLLSSLDSELFLPVWGILLLALLGGPIGAVVSTAIGAGIYLLVGRLFKGEATYTEMFRAILTGQIPQIWLFPLLLFWMLVFPETYFVESDQLPFEDTNLLSMIFFLVLGVVSIWTFVVQCKAVGEAHRLSAWKGFFIIVLPGIVFIGVIVAIIAAVLTTIM
ncbi:YIP1 family protein [Planococcus sp. ANT_H30]|nr:YIP1 family protein [Planococcus sp. ANT_H30]